MHGSLHRSAAPIWKLQGDLLADNEAINTRWSERFAQLFNRSSSIDPSAVGEVPARPLHTELDDTPTEDEVREAIDELQCGKSAGIPPEVFKTGGQIHKFTEFLCTCWKDGCLPQDLKDARIMHLYIGKGDTSSCDNYRGISFLSIAGKILSKRLETGDEVRGIQSGSLVCIACLYGCESWTLYHRHVKLLDQLHQRCLRRFLNIKWYNRVSSAKVLLQAQMPNIDTLLTQSQLKWSGHLARMRDKGLAKKLCCLTHLPTRVQ